MQNTSQRVFIKNLLRLIISFTLTDLFYYIPCFIFIVYLSKHHGKNGFKGVKPLTNNMN